MTAEPKMDRSSFRHFLAIPTRWMDNDVYGTDYCIGFSTAVTRSVEFIHRLRTSVGSHERIAVVELFGRNSGETSLIAAYLAGVDRGCFPLPRSARRGGCRRREWEITRSMAVSLSSVVRP